MTQTQGRRGQLKGSLITKAQANDVHVLIHPHVKPTVCKGGSKPTLRRTGTLSQGIGLGSPVEQ